MKKYILFTIAIFFALTINAQQLPNNDFENWTDVYNAVDWNSEITILITIPTAERTTDSYHDNYAVKLETKNYFDNVVPGFILLGEINPDTYMPEGGIEFTDRPTGISFFYKYSPAPNDSMMAIVLLTKWNDIENKRDTIAGTIVTKKEQVGTYTKVSQAIYYQSADAPDTLNVGFMSSGQTPVAGSILLVDSVTMEYGLENYPTICLPASSVTTNKFTASWLPVFYATGYYLDVATDENFTNFVSGYNNKYFAATTIGYETLHTLSGLETSKYYYRVRVQYIFSETSENSNVQSVAMPTDAHDATNITHESFTANWVSVPSATDYKIDIATDQNFTNYLAGYEDVSTNNVNSYDVSGLSATTNYFYRVRVIYGSSVSSSSDTIQVTTGNNTGINNTEKENFKIYSANKIVYVKSKNNSNYKITIFNILGEKISEQNNNNKNSEFHINKKGIYIISITNKKEIFTQKIIIN